MKAEKMCVPKISLLSSRTMMDSAQFLVHWDEHPTHITSRLGYLLEHQSHVDVTLMCNTHTLKVHRAVLAASSPYFERQLGNHPLIVLKDMKFSVLKSLVEFMYCGETSVTEDNLTPLLEAAKFFEIKGLSSMTKETVCGPSSSKSINGNTTPTTSNFSRGRGRGRGRGRPPLNMSTPAKASSPTEPAHILLSLSGTPTTQIFNSHKKDTSSSSSDKSLTPKFAFEPRRRGRKRGAVNSAFRDRLLREADTHLAIENLKRDLSDSNDYDSPLLSSLLNKNKTDNKYLKDMSSTSGMDSEDQKSVTMLSLTGSKSIDDATFQSLKNGAVSEAENEPEAVVLYEVTGDQQVEKHVLSAKEMDLLKSLNEELTNQKRELASLPENDEKSAELKVKIEKTKSVLSQVVGCIKDKLKCAFPDQNSKKTQMVQLEFIDGNGEKIEGYQVTGTVVDKKEPKEDYGLFNMVCPNTSPLIGGEDKKTFQLEDSSQMYEIGAMMNDSNVGEDKTQDFKYMIDNDSNIMNQEDNFIVYESENVIYDGSQIPIEPSADYIVSDEVVYNDDGTEYVEYNDKVLEIKEINESYNFCETESRQETETKRMNSFSGCKRRSSTSSDSSDRPTRRRKNDPTLLQALNEESL